LDNLIPLVRGQLGQNGQVAARRVSGDLKFRDDKGHRCFLRILPFRPLPEHIRDAYEAAGDKSHLTVCAYEECDLNDKRAKALRWLASKTESARGFPRKNILWPFCGGELLR